jgi:hypothetical protein
MGASPRAPPRAAGPSSSRAHVGASAGSAAALVLAVRRARPRWISAHPTRLGGLVSHVEIVRARGRRAAGRLLRGVA